MFTVNMAKSGSRSTYHHGDLRSALLMSAAALLERDGPEALSLRAVARATGVSQTAPYNHFPDKAELLATLAANGFREITRVQTDAAAGVAMSSQQMAAIGCAYVEFACRHPQLYRLMFGAGVSDWSNHAEVETAKQASYEPVQRAVAVYLDGTPQGEQEIVHVAAWALVHGLAMLLIDGTLVPPEAGAAALVEAVVGRFVAGLKG